MKDLEILYSDNHLLVVNKPACLPVVPDDSGDESLLDQGKAWIKREFGKPGAVFLGVVHRLDRPVSGVVVFARTSKAADRLSAQFRERTANKTYWGIVEGQPSSTHGEIQQYLWKDGTRNRVQVVNEDREGARLAHTSYRVVRMQAGRTLLELSPHTGRSHQLRLACKTLGTPLCGDLKYGAEAALSDRSIALHARQLEVDHPTKKETFVWKANVPTLDIWRAAKA
ncbi:MAG: 23S rRNA pseudouridine1911/1915/1917 synthase [Planctomycetota bacterium]|jgi:23S rRNA pseudouridine1911/1915/1917 synthase